MAGRKAKSSAVAERDGTYKKDPQRRNLNEPKPKRGIPPKPMTVELCPIASAQWDWICGQLDSMGVLTVSDLLVVEALAVAYGNFRQSWEQMREEGMTIQGVRGPVRNPIMLDYHKYQDRIVKLLAELGLTPSSRSRLVSTNGQEDDPFLDFLNLAKSKQADN